MASEVVRRVPLDGETDFVDVRLFVERGKVVGMILNYTAVIRGIPRVVCRYDTCHGHLHVHRYWIRGGEPRDLEAAALSQPLSYAERVAEAEADLLENWRTYRAKMELIV